LYEDQYENFVTAVQGQLAEVSDCARLFTGDDKVCSDCFKQCSRVSLQCVLEYQEFNLDSNTALVQEGIEFIDDVHKEVNKMSSFLLKLLSQFQPIMEEVAPVKEHLMEKLKLNATEIVEIFESLKFLNPYEGQKVILTHPEVKQVRSSVDKLLKSMGGESSSDLIDEEELIPFVHVPKKPKQDKSVWDHISDFFEDALDITIDVSETVWDTTKDVSAGAWDATAEISSSAWDATKDVSSTAYCSVKSTFFSSDCNKDKRKRRDAEEGEQKCDPERTIGQIETECLNIPSCQTCSNNLVDKCSSRDLSELVILHENLSGGLKLTESEMKQLLDQSEIKRQELITEAFGVFYQNLWIVPLAQLFQQNKEQFQIEDIRFDPTNYYQAGGKVFYRNVQAKMNFGNLLLTLEPVDVHNETLTAQFAADAFVNRFKALDSVYEAVLALIKDMNIWNGV